jgi:hypothetical protein
LASLSLTRRNVPRNSHAPALQEMPAQQLRLRRRQGTEDLVRRPDVDAILARF